MTRSPEEQRDERRVRAAHNQALFREVNERIEELEQNWGPETSFICECLDRSCSESISVSLEEYERVRSDPASFLVAPGHQVMGVEEIVSENDRFTVVRKLGAGYQAAAQADPRRPRTA